MKLSTSPGVRVKLAPDAARDAVSGYAATHGLSLGEAHGTLALQGLAAAPALPQSSKAAPSELQPSNRPAKCRGDPVGADGLLGYLFSPASVIAIGSLRPICID
jgi:hypothetical protein